MLAGGLETAPEWPPALILALIGRFALAWDAPGGTPRLAL